jgi:hypothetical protein
MSFSQMLDEKSREILSNARMLLSDEVRASEQEDAVGVITDHLCRTVVAPLTEGEIDSLMGRAYGAYLLLKETKVFEKEALASIGASLIELILRDQLTIQGSRLVRSDVHELSVCMDSIQHLNSQLGRMLSQRALRKQRTSIEAAAQGPTAYQNFLQELTMHNVSGVFERISKKPGGKK